MTEKPHSYVPPSGPKDALIALVGEQPGRQEVLSRKPFVGPSGHVLIECLNAVGIARTECYFTNVIKDLDKHISSYINLASKGQSILPFGQHYIDELKTELEGVKSNVIVAVGNIALFALTSRTGITKWRGSVLESTLLPGRKIIPVIHPATVLPPKNVYLNKYLIVHDLNRAKQHSSYPESGLIDRDYITGPSFYDILSFLHSCKEWGLKNITIDFDIELYNEQISCISFTYSPSFAMSIPFVHSKGDYLTVDQEAEVWLEIASILENPKIKKRGQNILFDTHLLLRYYGIKTVNLDDTMIAQQIISPDYPKGLDFITSIYTDLPYYKAEGKKWFKVGGAWETLWQYNARDSIACAIAFPKQLEELTAQGNLKTYERQKGLIEPLAYMQERGIKCDIVGMKNGYAHADEKLKELQEELNHVAGKVLNPNSPKQLKEYFYLDKGIKPYRKSGKPTTNDDALKRLARRGFREASIIQKMRRTNKERSNYLDPSHVDPDGRIRCSYNPVGTHYSRISSSKNIFGTGTNLQNWPHSMLKYLIADDGYLYYSFDLSQFENRIVAYVGPVPQMIEAFESGTDVHSLTASLIFEKPITDVSREDGSSTLGDGMHSERFWGKGANHKLNYDIGYKSFALEYELPEPQSKYIIEKYHNAYPGVRQGFHNMVRKQLAKNRILTNLMGRRTKFMGRWEDKLFKEAYSCIPQGTCGDIINERGVNYIYYNQDLFGPIELLTQVHDSVGFQIPLTTTWYSVAMMLNSIKAMLETPLEWHGREFVVPVDLSVGLNMGEVNELSHKYWPSNDRMLAEWLEQNYDQLLNKGRE